MLDEPPDLVEVDLVVVVDGDVPEASDAFPWDLRMSVPERRRQPLRRLADDLQSPKDGVLCSDVLLERGLSRLAILDDEPERVPDVKEDDGFAVLQTGIASRRTASRM